MNIVIPMAGHGRRFKEVGFAMPKPLIDVGGKPMIKAVIDNINTSGTYIFLVLKEHYYNYALGQKLTSMVAPNKCEIIQVDSVTEGAACTVLLAEGLINNDDELLLANSDQLVEWAPTDFLSKARSAAADGSMLTFYNTHPKWSYAKIDDQGLVTEVAEKNPISTNATVGIYWFRRGRDFVSAAESMITKNIRTNNEFYVCPVYNEMIAKGQKVCHYAIGEMHGLGTPEDLQEFLKRKTP